MPEKINRKTFFAGWFLITFLIVLFEKIFPKDETIVTVLWIICFVIWVLLVDARCNDIGGIGAKKKVAILVGLFIPLIGFGLLLYLLFARGAEYEEFLRAQQSDQSAQLKSEDNFSKRTEKFSELKGTLLKDLKSLWILVFCGVSLLGCIFYVPYNLVHPDRPGVVAKTAHSTIFEVPEKFKPQLTKVDYGALAFREGVLLIACIAGYTISTIVKKK